MGPESPYSALYAEGGLVPNISFNRSTVLTQITNVADSIDVARCAFFNFFVTQQVCCQPSATVASCWWHWAPDVVHSIWPSLSQITKLHTDYHIIDLDNYWHEAPRDSPAIHLLSVAQSTFWTLLKCIRKIRGKVDGTLKQAKCRRIRHFWVLQFFIFNCRYLRNAKMKIALYCCGPAQSPPRCIRCNSPPV